MKRNTLEGTIALVTAMYESLEAGECMTDAQVLAAESDRILSVLWCRIQDHAHYKARRGRLGRVAFDDRTSEAIERHREQARGLLYNDGAALTLFFDEVFAAALKPSAGVLRWRRRKARKRPQPKAA